MLALSLVTWHEARAFDRQHKEVYAESASDHSGNINSGLIDKDSSAGAFGDSLRKKEAEAEKRKRLAEEEAKQKEAESAEPIHGDLPSDSSDGGGSASEEGAEGNENTTDMGGTKKETQTKEGTKDVGESAGGVLQVFEITAYTAGFESTGKVKGDEGYGVTASGEVVSEGRTAACPPSIPFGTKLEIEGMGVYVCEDRGADITEGRLDIYTDSLDEARQFGRKTLEVNIIE